MKYMILHYFFMVHLCNIKMSAISMRHKYRQAYKGRHYDIDGFISQLLASRKFDDLAEKLAEKAANKIMHIDAAPAPIQRATDDIEFNDSTKSIQEISLNQSNREYVNTLEKYQMNNMKLRKEFTGKINPQAVINATSSLTENLQLKYKYLKKNALEKRVKSNQNPLLKNDTKEDQSKYNKTTGPADIKDRNDKIEEPISNQDAKTEKNQNDTKKESIDETKRSRDDAKDDDRKEDPKRHNELNESFNSSKEGETNGSSRKPGHSLEELSPGQKLKIFREAKNSGPEDKGIVEKEASRVNNGIRENKASSLEEDDQKLLTRSKEKNINEVEKTKGDPVKRGAGEINEGENVIAQFRAREDSIQDNIVTSDSNPYVGVYRTRVSDDSSDVRSKEQSPEDQRSKEQSPEDQRSKEQSPEDQRSKEQSSEQQSSQEQSGVDSNFSKLKPVIRKEGDKLYTYVRAPDYKDYHENLAEWQKNHPKNPVDFMK